MSASARRGQAFTETVIFLPVFLIVLFGIIWIVQSSVVNERLQFAVRYSGLISSQASPYSAWSLYSLYENTEYPNAAMATHTCGAPSTNVLANASPFPGPTSDPFWQPVSTGVPACTPATVTMTGAPFVQPAIFSESISALSAAAAIPSYLTSVNPSLSSPQLLSATQKFFTAPDMKTMLACYGDLEAAVQQSLQGQGDTGNPPPTPLPLYPTGQVLNAACPSP